MARTYTDTERTDAIAVYLEHGLAEAHRRTGITKQSIHRWAKEAGIDTAAIAGRSSEKTAAATKAHTERMQELRVKAQAEFAASALHAAGQVRECEKGTDAQGWATAGGICLDKLRLELGEVTDRTERRTVDQVTAEVERLAEELAQR